MPPTPPAAPPPPPPPRPAAARALAALEHLAWTALLLLVVVPQPLFTSNQNTKYLAGAARAGVGLLAGDWLANTTDPFPLFTLLVEGMFRLGAPWLSYAGLFALLALYLGALRSVAARVGGRDDAAFLRTFLLLAVIAHAAILDLPAGACGVHDGSRLFRGGLAQQSVIGGILQPSVFGALLLAAVALHLADRPYAAAAATAACATLHPSYLFAAAVFVPALAWDRARRDGGPRRALAATALALAALLPTALWLRAAFAPSSPESWAEATRLLVTVRIPHHALPSRFLDGFGWLQVAWLAAGAAAAWRTPLRRVVLVPTAVAAILTAAQAATGSLSLAAAQPWRLTVFLAPLAIAVVGAAVARRAAGSLAAKGSLVAVAAVALAYGLVQGYERWEYHLRRDPGLGVYRWARENAREGDLFVVPLEDERFRLEAGAPVLANFKSHPNRDDEFLEWLHRADMTLAAHAAPDPAARARALDLARRKYGVTHFVGIVGRHPLPPGFADRVYADALVEAWRLR